VSASLQGAASALVAEAPTLERRTELPMTLLLSVRSGIFLFGLLLFLYLSVVVVHNALFANLYLLSLSLNLKFVFV